MPVFKASLLELRDHLDNIGLSYGMNVAIHSNLFSFGLLENGVEGLYHSIRSIIGPDATIVVPTYNLNLTNEDIFDPLKTKPFGMGIFSNYIMNRSDSLRTLSPIHSHAINGPLQKKLFSSNYKISMGPNSIFEDMQKENFYLLLLGCSFQDGATFVHHVEACTGVCYRQWINLERVIRISKNVTEEISLKYYGRKADNRNKTNLDLFQKKIVKAGICSKVIFRNSSSFLVNFEALFSFAQQQILSDQNIFLQSNEHKTSS